MTPIRTAFKNLGRRAATLAGYDVTRRQPPGSHLRDIGHHAVYHDFKARGFAPSLIFDVGASDGWWTEDVRPIFPGARFVQVEPRDTGLAGAVRAAVGATQGAATLTDWGTGSTVLPVDPEGHQQITVPVTTLDRLAAQFGIPDFVKLDIEGLELEAIKGATTLLGRTELFVIEVSLYRFSGRPQLHDVVAAMAAHGYFVYDIAGFIRRPWDGAVALMDLCFARTLRGSETEWHPRP